MGSTVNPAPADDRRIDVRVDHRIVEATVRCLFAAVAALVLVLHQHNGWRAWLLAAMVVILGNLAAIDVAEHRLPNRLVVPLISVSWLAIAADAAFGPLSTGRALAAFSAGVGAAVVLAVLRYGMGDVKLVLAIGAVAAWLGSAAVTWTVVATSLSGGVAAATLMIVHRRFRVDFGFGPFLAIGSAAGMVAAGLTA